MLLISSRSEASARSRGGSVQGHRHNNEQEESDLFDHLSSDHVIQQESTDHNMADEDFPDEDFDDLPLDELDSVIFPESTNATAKSGQFGQHTLTGSMSQLGSRNSRFTSQHRDSQNSTRRAVATSKPVFPSAASEPSHESGRSLTNDESDFMDDDMDCFLDEVETYGVETRESDVQQGPSIDRECTTNQTEISSSSFKVTCNSSRTVADTFSIKVKPAFESSHSIPQVQSHTSSSAECDGISAKNDPQGNSTVPALTLTSPPFTYLCLLEELISKPHPHTIEIRIKAFIVTLLGKLSSSNGLWRVSATISDGTGYLDVELSDKVLTGLLGFSVAEKGALKRDPARRHELDAGMRRCQEELVDMCCVMTIVVEPEGRKAVVTKADPVNEKVFQELEQRVRNKRK